MREVPREFPINCFSDTRGRLGVVEETDLPFPIKRIYYLFDVPLGAVRGEHAHKSLRQLVICMNGVCDIALTDGYQQYTFHLSTPADGLYIPAGMWRKLNFREPSTVCCVLASELYNKDDYIFYYEDFLKWVRESKEDRLS